MNECNADCKEVINVKKTPSRKLSQRALAAKRVRSSLKTHNQDFICNSVPSEKQIYSNLTYIDINKNVLFNEISRASDSFYKQPCTVLAQALLGKILCRKLPLGEVLKGEIVETEGYLGIEDKASHSYKGKRTERNEAMFLSPGTAYVYSIYGMYYCFNISSAEEGSAVLIRALKPIQGMETMRSYRLARRGSSVIKDKDLCNGPSKLCQALNIQKQLLNKVNLYTSQDLWIEEGADIAKSNIISCKRIGIDSYGEEWANKPLRYYIKDCIYVSIRNKEAEKLQNSSIAEN